jgi:hypothetical protein
MMQQGPEGCPSGPFAQRLTALLPAVSAATAEVTAHGGKAAVVTVARIDIAQITIGVFRVH